MTRHETEGGNAAALGAANWLRLAAAPTFAIMALLTSVPGGSPTEVLCSAMHGTSALTGMVPMYLLMSVFHLGPWLRLIFRRISLGNERTMDQPPSDAPAVITAP